MTTDFNKYREAALLLEELFDSGQEVINKLSETEVKAYLNKREIDLHWFNLKDLQYIVETVDGVIAIVREK